MRRPILHILCGLSGSGKSTIAQTIAFNWNSDKARDRWKKRFGEDKYRLLIDFNECDKSR